METFNWQKGLQLRAVYYFSSDFVGYNATFFQVYVMNVNVFIFLLLYSNEM